MRVIVQAANDHRPTSGDGQSARGGDDWGRGGECSWADWGGGKRRGHYGRVIVLEQCGINGPAGNILRRVAGLDRDGYVGSPRQTPGPPTTLTNRVVLLNYSVSC